MQVCTRFEGTVIRRFDSPERQGGRSDGGSRSEFPSARRPRSRPHELQWRPTPPDSIPVPPSRWSCSDGGLRWKIRDRFECCGIRRIRTMPRDRNADRSRRPLLIPGMIGRANTDAGRPRFAAIVWMNSILIYKISSSVTQSFGGWFLFPGVRANSATRGRPG